MSLTGNQVFDAALLVIFCAGILAFEIERKIDKRADEILEALRQEFDDHFTRPS